MSKPTPPHICEKVAKNVIPGETTDSGLLISNAATFPIENPYLFQSASQHATELTHYEDLAFPEKHQQYQEEKPHLQFALPEQQIKIV
jgi:hypothetical protein